MMELQSKKLTKLSKLWKRCGRLHKLNAERTQARRTQALFVCVRPTTFAQNESLASTYAVCDNRMIISRRGWIGTFTLGADVILLTVIHVIDDGSVLCLTSSFSCEMTRFFCRWSGGDSRVILILRFGFCEFRLVRLDPIRARELLHLHKAFAFACRSIFLCILCRWYDWWWRNEGRCVWR